MFGSLLRSLYYLNSAAAKETMFEDQLPTVVFLLVVILISFSFNILWLKSPVKRASINVCMYVVVLFMYLFIYLFIHDPTSCIA